MKRRDILKQTAYITGAAVSAPLAMSLLTGCKGDPAEVMSESLAFFSEDDMAIVKEVVDIIIPRTDTPSASDVGVHQVIDHMVGKVYNQEDQDAYSSSISKLIGHFKQSEDLEKSVTGLEAEGGSKELKGAYLQLKEQAIAYYLNSEEIGTKHLTYLPVPGQYQGCISVEEAGGKKWAI